MNPGSLLPCLLGGPEGRRPPVTFRLIRPLSTFTGCIQALQRHAREGASACAQGAIRNEDCASTLPRAGCSSFTGMMEAEGFPLAPERRKRAFRLAP